MLKYFLIFGFLAANVQLIKAQDPFLLPSGAKVVNVKNCIKEGFYLLKGGNFPNEKGLGGLEIVKSYTQNAHVIRLSSASNLKFSENDSLYEISADWKLAPSLHNFQPEGPVLLSVNTVDAEEFKLVFNLRILQQHKNFLVIEAFPDDYTKILNSDLVTHISLYTQPQVETPINQHDLTVNNINYVHHLFPQIQGNDLKVSIKEFLFDTTDIDLRNRYEFTGVEAETLDRHATLIATVIVGAGNSSSRGKGIAPAAVAGSSSFLQLFPDDNSSYLDNEIFVQNHSYGTGIEISYGNEASAYDSQVNEVPELVHVFSAGNKGLETPDAGNYAGISGVANMTGNFKMAKNVLTVGAVDREKKVEARSSKGPANDGRLKPELVAYAPEGTSDAAALVSGTALLLQELYRKKEGVLPEFSLIKAVLIAGAEDVGVENIDFSAGYGNLDAHESLKIIEAGNYIEGEISGNDPKNFRITIPEGTKTLKVAISWIDPAANPGDEVTLKNDLNLQIKDPSGNLWLPWILSKDPENLNAPAQRGRDHLNPSEIITLEDPVAGEYMIEVAAEDLFNDSQKFSIAYTTVAEDEFLWTFPTYSDAVNNNLSPSFLRWKSSFAANSGKLEVNLNDEGWVTMDENIDLKRGFYEWNSFEKSGRAQLRMTIGSTEFLSDFFAVSPELVPEVVYNCEEEVLLSWERVENATAYQLQNLGSFYMQDFMEVEDTSVVINKDNFSSDFWSVVPIFKGSRGPAGFAVNYEEQGVLCYYQNFYALLDEGPGVNATLNLSTSAGIEKIIFRRDSGGEISTLEEFTTPFNNLQFTITDSALKAGNSSFYVTILLSDGREIKTNEVKIFVPGENTLEVYPNPVRAGDDLTVISKGDDLDIQIFDMQGRLLSENDLIRYIDRFQIRFYTRGMYIIRISRRGKQGATAKILVY